MIKFDHNPEDNMHTHGGYNVNDLYVERKYATFKEEICNYKYITITDYNDTILPKVQEYFDTDCCRQMCCEVEDISKSDGFGGAHAFYASFVPLRYGIDWNDRISFDHIMSVVLYTDFTEHCRDFSSTFRGCGDYETFSSIKARNAAYWWMSRRLRETVQIFGGRRDPLEEQKYCMLPSFCLFAITLYKVKYAFIPRFWIIILYDIPSSNDQIVFTHVDIFGACSRYQIRWR